MHFVYQGVGQTVVDIYPTVDCGYSITMDGLTHFDILVRPEEGYIMVCKEHEDITPETFALSLEDFTNNGLFDILEVVVYLTQYKETE